MTKTYFTQNKQRNKHTLTGTILMPSQKTMLSKNFDVAYVEQLREVVYMDNGMDQKKMHDIMSLTEWVTREEIPVQLVGNLQPARMRSVVYLLNKFFKDNLELLTNIYDMYVGKLNEDRVRLLRKQERESKARGLDIGTLVVTP